MVFSDGFFFLIEYWKKKPIEVSITTDNTFDKEIEDALVKDGCCSQGNSPDYCLKLDLCSNFFNLTENFTFSETNGTSSRSSQAC